MESTPTMKRRPIFLPDPLWSAVRESARKRGIPAAELVRRWLEEGVAKEHGPFDPAKVEQLRHGLTMFGGRRRGQACGCGNGTLEATRHEGVAFTGWTIDCTACAAGYDEQGRHYCPVCEEYRDNWQGGTDSAPRPWCSKCGNLQPGWKDSEALEARARKGVGDGR